MVLVLENLNNFRLDLGKLVNLAKLNEPKSTFMFLCAHKTALQKHTEKLFFSIPIPNHHFERHNLFQYVSVLGICGKVLVAQGNAGMATVGKVRGCPVLDTAMDPP